MKSNNNIRNNISNNCIMTSTPTDDVVTTMNNSCNKSRNGRRIFSTNNRFIATTIIPFLTCILYAILLLQHHVSATTDSEETNNNNNSNNYQAFIHRIKNDQINTIDKILFGSLIMLAFELLQIITRHFPSLLVQSGKIQLIPVRGKHLDILSNKDFLFIGLNKLATAPFVYFFLRYAYYESNVIWTMDFETPINNTNNDSSPMSVSNIWHVLQIYILPIPLIFIIYDFFYTILHWALHIKSIYGYIHKHHHTQKAPSRANIDAINVHPIEFFLGEYNHLFALWIVCSILHIQIHVISTLLFLAIGGILAGLNHTRYDIIIPSMFVSWNAKKTTTTKSSKTTPTTTSINIYDSKVHDVHHRIPQSNYGQYIMLWDYMFGTYRPYDPNDRINPKAQLNMKTGKSIEYEEEQQRKLK